METSASSRWIIEHATGSDDWYSLLDTTCRALLTMGRPLWRVSLGTMTLDPSIRVFGLHWHTGQGVSASSPDPHGPVREAACQRSPIQALAQRGEHIGRWRLDALRPALGIAMAKLNLSQTLRDVLSIHVGRTAGAPVLEGQIRRGQGRTVPAAILCMALRGVTTPTDRTDPLTVVGCLDERCDAMGKPVTGCGGEILTFVGDGVLAIRPVHDASVQPCPVCGKALDAATDALRANIALNARRRTENVPERAADLLLHFGDVVDGNVGSDRRLDFTVIGRAVNEASRIEVASRSHRGALCGTRARAADLGRLRCRCARALAAVGTVSLRGLANPQHVWSAASPLG